MQAVSQWIAGRCETSLRRKRPLSASRHWSLMKHGLILPLSVAIPYRQTGSWGEKVSTRKFGFSTLKVPDLSALLTSL
jgi:hypothetical protein